MRKNPRALARIKLGLQNCLYLGNMDAPRGLGHAKVKQDRQEDCVIATGVQCSVRNFVKATANELEIALCWEGSGVDEKVYLVDAASGKRVVAAVDPRYFRPAEVKTLLCELIKAKKQLNCSTKISFEELVREELISATRRADKEYGY